MRDTVEAQHVAMTHVRALKATLVVAAGVFFYVALSLTLGLTHMYGGFLFSIYYLAVKEGDLSAFVPSLSGAAVGIVIALVFHELPLHAGASVALAGIVAISLVLTFVLIAQTIPLVTNLATVVFLTVAAIPALSTREALGGMMVSLFFGAALILAGQLAARTIRRRG